VIRDKTDKKERKLL